ncbi:MAG: 4Fe-4S dicluster domain-containing protein [Asgard group archaeon]|nr:4Fe-4S dicluster domain-containing protein [Asgard group archaeon]
MPVEIDRNICGLCLGCATICPESLYYIEEEELVIKEGCTDCGLCIECCPVKAIREKQAKT